MTADRYLPKNDYLALKAATRRLVTLAGRGPAAAQITRVGQQELSNYGNPYSERVVFMPADVIADLEAECSQPVVTGLLAEMLGFVLVPLPQKVPGLAPLATRLGQLGKEAGDVFIVLGQALKDGEITADEGEHGRREIDELVLAALTLRAELEKATEQEGDGE